MNNGFFGSGLFFVVMCAIVFVVMGWVRKQISEKTVHEETEKAFGKKENK